MKNVLKINNLSYEINNKKILDNINFSINVGEFISIIGPNGAGKTSLVKCLSNNLKYTGEIYLFNKNIKDYSMKEKAKLIGVVPQEYNLPFNFKVKDIVKMGRNPYWSKYKGSTNYDIDIIEKSMVQTNTLQYKDRLYNSLSGGEKQRVVTARTIAQQPEIMYLDEITSNLDIHNQLEILELIYEMNRLKKITVVSIMHDLNLASRFSDKILLMIDGKIEMFDTPENVFNEDVLSKAYDMEMLIRENKILRFKEIIPMRVKRSKSDKNINIHIICGGGTGQYIIEVLYSKKYNLTCGIISEGDSDYDLCKNLNIKCISEVPFSKFGNETIRNNLIEIEKSDIIVVTDVPIGNQNIENLKSIENINDKKIIILHTINRDYVNGEADIIINKLKLKTNVFLAINLKELFDLIESK